MKKIRVAHVLFSFGTGGLEKGIATLAQHASEDIEHIILCLSSSGESEQLLPKGARVLSLGKSDGNSVAFLWRLSRILSSLRPDVVHTRNWSGMDGIIAARLAGCRKVVHGEHGWGMDDPYGLDRKRVNVRKFLSRWVCEYTCVSKRIEEWLQAVICSRRRVNQIYNGVDPAKYRLCENGKRIRLEIGIPANAFIVGVVGRLDPIKDHPTLFKAIADVLESTPETRLVVIGDGSERHALEAIAPEGTIFLGNRSDVPEILGALDVFVLPSLNEGISNTILEAMAAGLPVVATRVGGNAELVMHGYTGALVEPKDDRALGEAILSYLRAPSLRELHGAAGRKRVLESFSVGTMVSAYESVYRRVALMPTGG